MKNSKHLFAGVLTGVMLFTTMPTAFAASHYNDASATGTSASWSSWATTWAETAAEFTKVSMTPGADQTKLNFAWYSKDSSKQTPIVHFGTSKADLKAFTGVCAAVDASLTGSEKYDYNHVTVTGLKENTTYYYTVEKDGVQTAPEIYKTGSFENVRILYVGDPQIGASRADSERRKTRRRQRREEHRREKRQLRLEPHPEHSHCPESEHQLHHFSRRPGQ